MTKTLAGKTIIMSGGSRGIGLAIALRAAQDGANVVIVAKTAEPDERLNGTVFTAAAQIEAAGGQALPVVGDVRSNETIESAVAQAVERFGGVDICINNASALNLAPTREITARQFDLMHDVGPRATFLLTKACIPYLAASENPHVLTLSPPFNWTARWMGAHPAYTLAKYGMSTTALAFAAELAAEGIASNALWPRTTIATDAVGNLLGGVEALGHARVPRIMSDAAHIILTSPSRELTGRLLIDDEVLASHGVTDLAQYSAGGPSSRLDLDFFVDDMGTTSQGAG